MIYENRESVEDPLSRSGCSDGIKEVGNLIHHVLTDILVLRMAASFQDMDLRAAAPDFLQTLLQPPSELDVYQVILVAVNGEGRDCRILYL